MAAPNDNFNDNSVGNGYTVVGAGVVEANSRLELTPPDGAACGLIWDGGTVDLTAGLFRWRVLNPSSLGFNAVATMVRFTDPTTGYHIDCIVRTGWTAQVKYFDNVDAQIGSTHEAAFSIDDDTYSYQGAQWHAGVVGGEPGLRFINGTSSALDETNRSVVYGNVGAVPATFAANFDPTAADAAVYAYRLGGSGTTLVDDFGGTTGDGTIAEEPPPASASSKVFTAHGLTSAPADVPDVAFSASSSDPAVATVEVTGVNTVTISAAEGATVGQSCNVTIDGGGKNRTYVVEIQ